LKGRLQNQVFRRIAGKEQFRQDDEIGASGPRLRAGVARLGGVAGDVAHRRVELSQRDGESGFGHGAMVPWARTNCKCIARIQLGSSAIFLFEHDLF
jgi:hypothetical protein